MNDSKRSNNDLGKQAQEGRGPVPGEILQTEGLSSIKALDSVLNEEYRHVCQRDGFAFVREVQASKLLISNPNSLLQFPGSSILRPDAVGPRTERDCLALDQQFDCSEQKREILERVVVILKNKIFREMVISDVITIADEIFTNAIYDAPFVNPVTGEVREVSRDVQSKYEPGKTARLILGIDESRILIGCIDPFGSLNVRLFLSKIRDGFASGTDSLLNLDSRGGAGLGSFMIFNSLASLYIGVKPNVATIVIGVLPFDISKKRREQLENTFIG